MSSAARMERLLGIAAVVLVPVLLFIGPYWTTACLETPKSELQSSPLVFHLRGMYESTLYDQNTTWKNATDTLKQRTVSMLYAAKDHLDTSRGLLGGLEDIQQSMQEADQAVEAALRMRNEHARKTEIVRFAFGKADPKRWQEEARQAAHLQAALTREIAKASDQLSEAESKMGTLLSQKASARERDGAAIKEAEAQLADALASTDTLTQKGDYGIGILENRMRRIAGVPFFQWLGYSQASPQAWPQMQADADDSHVEHACSAGKELLHALGKWEPLNEKNKDKWNGIDSRRQEDSHNSEPDDHVRVAIAGLLGFLQEYRNNQVEEIELFMETWGPGAGYSWETVAPGTRAATACRVRDRPSPDGDFISWLIPDAA